jgi:hypothetical protein
MVDGAVETKLICSATGTSATTTVERRGSMAKSALKMKDACTAHTCFLASSAEEKSFSCCGNIKQHQL